MVTNQSLSSILDKTVETMPLKEIVKQSPAALSGLSEKKAELLKQALGVSTIAELASNKFVLQAQALATLSEHERF